MILWGDLTDNSAKKEALVAWLVVSARFKLQCFLFSRSIGKVTPKISYFHYVQNNNLDRCIHKVFYLILKSEALINSARPVPSLYQPRVHLQCTKNDFIC